MSLGRVFEASYPGRCACGDSVIEPGDAVRYEDDELCLVGCCADDSELADTDLGFEP